MVTATQANQLRELQQGAANLVWDELSMFFGSLNLERPEAVRDALLQYVPVLVARYGQGAASVAADWYDDVRNGMNVRGRFRARVADPVEVDRVEKAVRFAARHLFTPTPELTLAAIAAPAMRYVREPARFTIVGAAMQDPSSSGWQRRTKGDACDFCKALAARGAVYRRGTVDFAAHNDCGCVAVPSWDRRAKEVPVTVYDAAAATGGMSEAQKRRHNEKVANLIANYRELNP